VPKHNDFQVFEVVRSNVQDRELKNPPKNDVTEREEHEPSRAARKPPRSYASDSDINVGSGRQGRETGFMHATGMRSAVQTWRGVDSDPAMASPRSAPPRCIRDRRETVAIRSQLIYSCRRAIIGSVREARRAGTRHANAATTMSMIETAATVEK
jgi:hypothetical protein